MADKYPYGSGNTSSSNPYGKSYNPNAPAPGSMPSLDTFNGSIVGQLLQRLASTVYAAGAKRGLGTAGNVLLHGEPMAQEQRDLDTILQNMDPTFNTSPGIVKNIDRIVGGTALDPLTAAGGSGLLENFVREASPHIASALARGAGKANLGNLYDAFTHKGEAVRGIYGALPAKKAQQVINKAELVERIRSNRLKGGTTKQDVAQRGPQAQESKLSQAQARVKGRQTKTTRQIATQAYGESLTPQAREFLGKYAPPERSILDDLYNGPESRGFELRPTKSRRGSTMSEDERMKRVTAGLTKREKQAVGPSVRLYFAGSSTSTPGEVGKLAQSLARGSQRLVNQTNIPYFMLPVRHQANITSLGLLRDPLGAAIATGKHIAGAVSPKIKAANEALIHRGRQLGHTSFTPERETPELLQTIPGFAGRVARGMYHWSQKTLWDQDDLLRETLIQRAIDRGASRADAAHEVNRALVDYAMRSPFTQSLYNVAPFPTFRTGILGAVTRSTLQHPERLAIADRASGGVASGGQSKTGVKKLYLPPAEVARAVQDPDAYLRSTLAFPYDDLLSIMNVPPPVKTVRGKVQTIKGKNRDTETGYPTDKYFTYGKPVIQFNPKQKNFPGMLPEQLIKTPGSSELLSPFKKKGFWKDFIQSNLGAQL